MASLVDSKESLEKELDFAMEQMDALARNECVWNYVKGWFSGDNKYADFPRLLQKIEFY
jgi:hypothetical protein